MCGEIKKKLFRCLFFFTFIKHVEKIYSTSGETILTANNFCSDMFPCPAYIADNATNIIKKGNIRLKNFVLYSSKRTDRRKKSKPFL